MSTAFSPYEGVKPLSDTTPIPIATLRQTIRQRLVIVAQSDPRIVGLVDYGSTSEGRDDEWSDIDVALFLRDEAIESFNRKWKSWVAALGPLLLAYVGGVEHPWVVYEAAPIPLRADFAFEPVSSLEQILTWPIAPLSVERCVLYDGTGGQLTALAQKLVRQSLTPADVATKFEQVCGDFWYYLLRTFTKLKRGQEWAARHDFNFVIMGNLLALLRLECGAIEHWRGRAAAVGIEQVIAPERLRQLNECIPDSGSDALLNVMRHTAQLGHAVCQNIHQQHGWTWPVRLAQRVHQVLNDSLA